MKNFHHICFSYVASILLSILFMFKMYLFIKYHDKIKPAIRNLSPPPSSDLLVLLYRWKHQESITFTSLQDFKKVGDASCLLYTFYGVSNWSKQWYFSRSIFSVGHLCKISETLWLNYVKTKLFIYLFVSINDTS